MLEASVDTQLYPNEDARKFTALVRLSESKSILFRQHDYSDDNLQSGPVKVVFLLQVRGMKKEGFYIVAIRFYPASKDDDEWNDETYVYDYGCTNMVIAALPELRFFNCQEQWANICKSIYYDRMDLYPLLTVRDT